MKKILFIAALVIVNSSISMGQTNDKQALMKIEQELLDGLLKGDASVPERYLANDWMFTDPGGYLSGKAELIASIKAGDFKFESSTNDSMKVQVYGNTAVVNYRSTDKGHIKEMDISGQYRWTDVFVKQNGVWKIVSGQGTRIMQ